MRFLFRAALVAITGLVVASCGKNADEWTGVVYPDAAAPSSAVTTMQGFETFEKCQEAAISLLRTFEEPDAGGYSCVRTCKWDAATKTNVCEEVRR